MKRIFQQLYYFHLIVFLFTFVQVVQAQVQITTRVIPPYQSRIAEYASRPELMLISLTNTSTTEQSVQLTAKITGDNGIAAWVKPGYRSPRPIVIPAGQTINLNGNDIAFLFDINKIDYTGISRADMTRGLGLLEGNYTLCIRALQFNTLEPLSADEPIGCTSFRISDTEPPRVLSPFDEQVLDNKNTQAFSITWSTPAGSPPGIQYKIKLVEMIADRNPNDAMLSTRPILEETVNTNMLLYGPAHPALVLGRKYVLMVQAEDPLGRTFFRNQGKSEVIVFTYGKPGQVSIADAGSGKGTKQDTTQKPTQKFATNIIKGKLLWAYKSTEEKFKKPSSIIYNNSLISNNLSNSIVTASPSLGNVLNNNNSSSQGSGNNNFLAIHYLNHNPLQVRQATAMASADQTMNPKNTFGLVSNNNFVNSIPKVEASEIISSTGAESLSYENQSIQVDSGDNRYPLANTRITIRGIKSPIQSAQQQNFQQNNKDINRPGVSKEQDVQFSGLRTTATVEGIKSSGSATTDFSHLFNNTPSNNRNNNANSQNNSFVSNTTFTSSFNLETYQPNVIATGRTDAEGNFTIQMMNPQYEGIQQYERIVVAVETEGFEKFEYSIPIKSLTEATTIDLGEKLLLAKTYRLNPSIEINDDIKDGFTNPGLRVKVYRLKSDIQSKPYLQHEGSLSPEDRIEVVRYGQTYVLTALDSILDSGSKINSFNLNFAKLFYAGQIRVEIEPLIKILKPITSNIRIVDQKVSASQILVAKPTFKASLTNPAVSGQVILKAGENIVPVQGAVLSVSFNEEDRLPVNNNLGVLNQTVNNQTYNTAIVSNALNSSNSGFISNQEINQKNANLNFAATANASFGVANPVMINQPSNNLASGIEVVNNLVYGDGNLSEADLREKYGTYTVKTDSTGQFLIGNLPLLKEGANYTVKLVSVPPTFRDLAIEPSNEQTFIASSGVTETRSFTISPEIFQIVGRVIDDKNQGIPYARAHFKGSTNYFETGESGIFQTSYYLGRHILIVEKEGYLPLEVPITLGSVTKDIPDVKDFQEKVVMVKVVQPGEEVMNMKNVNSWTQNVQQTNTVKQAISSGQTFSPAMFGYASGGSIQQLQNNINNAVQGIGRSGPNIPVSNNSKPFQLQVNTGFQVMVNQSFRANDYVFSGNTATDLGDIGPMLPRQGKVKFIVLNKANKAPIANAEITLFDSIQHTNTEGIWLYEGFGGTATVKITPPSGSGLIPIKRSIQIDETGKITEVTIEMEKGVRVFGSISSGTKPIKEAKVSVEGRDYLSTLTNESGLYEMFIPSGEFEIKASKTGYFSKKESHIFQIDKEQQINFNLEDGGDRNISKLLGFDIELDKAEVNGNTEKWTGRFVNLKGMTPIFNQGQQTYTIPFSNVSVSFDSNGNPIPQNNEVITDLENLDLKVFGFLPVIIKGEQKIKVTKDAQGKGRIAGKIQVDLSRIQGSRGFKFPNAQEIFLTLQDATSASTIDVFKEDGTSAATVKLKLSTVSNNDLTLDLYGFSMKLELSNSFVGSEGLELVGEINTPNLGPISSAKLKIEQFKISKELRIQTVKIQQQNLPSINIASWKAQMTALLFNENGFKIGGNLTFTIPQSAPSNINFANLSLGKDALYGGEFSFPGSGISIYKIAQLSTGNRPLSFGRVGNTQVYYLSGSASLHFDKLFEDPIKIPSFQIQTDGRFMVDAPVNYSANLGFAKFKISSLTLSTLSGQAPSIGVQGEFNAEFPGLKFEASNIKFMANSNGQVNFSVGTIAGELKVAVMTVGVSVGLKENGFEGSGKLTIPQTPINAELGFHYYKVNGGIDLGAKFSSAVSIPIGIVEITKVGGGFSYNTSNKKFMVNINGAASITGMRAIVELNPISLTVESGPIITGQVGVVVGTTFKLADAYVVLNFPEKFFSIKVESNIEPLKGVASAQINGLLKIKWDPNESYVFLGAMMDINVLNIITSYGEFAMGVNIKNPTGRSDEIGRYFKYLSGDIYDSNSSFSGIYLHALNEFGVPEDEAVGIGGDIFGVSAWFYTTSDVMLLLNFAEDDYRIQFKGSVDMKGRGCFVGLCVTGGMYTCYSFLGGYNDVKGWYVEGKAGGKIEVGIGKNTECNSIAWCVFVPCGGKVCIGGHASLSISTNDGVDFSVGIGNVDKHNLCK